MFILSDLLIFCNVLGRDGKCEIIAFNPLILDFNSGFLRNLVAHSHTHTAHTFSHYSAFQPIQTMVVIIEENILLLKYKKK